MTTRRAAEAPPPPASAGLVVDLRQLSRHDLALAGGKGANLGDMVRAGFPVPAGFVVTTAAYDMAVAHGHLSEEIARLATGNQKSDGSEVWAAFARITVPPPVERDVLAAYQDLGRGPVAVRSSATAEDLPGAAFAGQQETFLNVEGDAALLDAVRRCWASLWSERAIAYRARLGLDQATVKLAVVVQRMVPAVAAGVMFTANPVTGARDEIVIDASPGLGEAVVAGLVTPDHYVLRRHRLPWRGWSIAERRTGRREVEVRALPGGGTERITPSAAAAEPALPDPVVRRLARLGREIQRHFGSPQDIEWAWTGRALSIVQSRPMTALPAAVPAPGVAQRLFAGILPEVMPVRPYPLETTTWNLELFQAAFFTPMFRLIGLRFDLDQVFVEEEGVVVRVEVANPLRLTPEILLAPFRLARQAWRYDPARWRDDPLLAAAHTRTRDLEARDLTALPWPELLGTVREALAIPFLLGELRVRYLPRPILAAAGLQVLLRLVGRSHLFVTLLNAGVETSTLAANRAIEALAARIRTDPALAGAFAGHQPTALPAVLAAMPAGQALLADFHAVLARYGHRETGGLLSLHRPTWKDAPDVVLGMLKGMSLMPQSVAVRPQSWQAARDEVLAQPLMRLAPSRAAFLRLLPIARYFPVIREDTHFDFILPLPILRRSLLEIGRRLADAGALDNPDDVFHLKWPEIEAMLVWPPPPDVIASLRDVAEWRRRQRAALAGTPLVDPRLMPRQAAGGDALLQGTPGSPGVAAGPVRVILDGSEFGRVRPGDVLVAPYTNPAWTPLFQIVAAVVVDSGGAASHAAIVAREYGVPAVMGSVDGTRVLTDGQRVRVDGAAGLVFAAGPAGEVPAKAGSGRLPDAAQVGDALPD